MNNVEKKKEFNFWDYWRIIIKRKRVIIAFSGALIFFTALFSFLATPKYKSTATLLIEEEETSKILSLDETFESRPQFFRDSRFFNTQLKLLKSISLAEKVATRMNLLSRPEFVSGKKIKNEKSKQSAQSNPNLEIAKKVEKNIIVEPIRDTKLVRVSFISSSPILAAEIVNALAEEFTNFSIEKRYETTVQASNFLDKQITDLREELAEKERELQKYGQEKELVYLTDTESTAISKFADLNAAYTKAQLNRIKAEAAYRELKDLTIDTMPQFVNDAVIQHLKTEYTNTKNEYDAKSEIFRDSYPEMITLKAKLNSTKEELQNEIKRAVDTSESEYRSALKEESSIKRLLDEQKVDVAQMESNAILYNSLKIEIENSRKLLNSLTAKQKETLVSARLGGLKSSYISIIDKGETPQSPISPKKKMNLILSLIIGLFGGVTLCFLFEYLDTAVEGPEDIERLAHIPYLGVIPYLDHGEEKKKKWLDYPTKWLDELKKWFDYLKKRFNYLLNKNYKEEKVQYKSELHTNIELVNNIHPKSSISEDYRTVRTSILLANAGQPPKTILFTSALPKEGKTATVANMAVAFSQLEKKVLVLDADLRKPQLNKVFGEKRNQKGLSGYLTGKVSLDDAIQKTSIDNIWLLPSGLIPTNPAELLNSQKMKEMMEELKKRFDIILIDSPPVLALVDAVIVSSIVDSTLLIVKAGKNKRRPFLYTIEELKRANSNIIGVLLNELKIRKSDYSFMNYYRYYRYHYYKEDEGEEKIEKTE